MNPALFLVDLQNAFCSSQGSFWKRDFSILALNEFIEQIESLLSFAHKNNVLVIFTRIEYNDDYSDAGLLVKEIAPKIIELGAYKTNSWDSKLYTFSNSQENDIVIVKKRYDPFIGTELNNILQQKGVTQLFIAGLLTNVCVESTARSAFDHDYKVTVISDATSTYSVESKEQSLLTISKHFGTIATVDEFCSIIANERKQKRSN